MDPFTLSDEDYEQLIGCMYSANMTIAQLFSTADVVRKWLLDKYTLQFPSPWTFVLLSS